MKMAAVMNFKAPSRKRPLQVEEESDESENESFPSEEEEEIEETPEEKRLRLAQIYLEELQKKEEEENIDVNAKLREQELEQNHKLVKNIADKFKDFSQATFHKDKIHQKPLTALVLSPKNDFMFTASKDGSIVKWSLNPRPKMALRKKSKYKSKDGENGHESVINTLAVNFDGTFLASGDDSKKVYIWKCSTLECVKVFQGHRGPVLGLAFARNKNVLYSCGKDRSVKTWDLDQMGYVETLFGHQDAVSCICPGISVDFITGGGRDGSVRLWKTTDEVQLVFNHSQGATIEAVDKINAELFLTVSDSGTISLWSSRKKTPVCSKLSAHGVDPINSTSNWISALATFPCSDLIASGSNEGFVRLWKVDNKAKSITEMGSFEVKGFINSMSFSSNGKFLYIAVGQEHRLGRWSRIKEAKNQVVCIELNYDE